MSGTSEAVAGRGGSWARMAVLAVGLVGVAAVWGLSAWWSFAEQTRGAQLLGFEHPAVLPYMLDVLGVSLAFVALHAALHGQSAGAARLGVLAALAGSVWANTRGVTVRFADAGLPTFGSDYRTAVAMAAVAPASAFLALEILLANVRRLVLWLRGEQAPAAVPAPRLVRWLLWPAAVGEWRRLVLAVTAPATPPAVPSGGHRAANDEDTEEDMREDNRPPVVLMPAPSMSSPGGVVQPVIGTATWADIRGVSWPHNREDTGEDKPQVNPSVREDTGEDIREDTGAANGEDMREDMREDIGEDACPLPGEDIGEDNVRHLPSHRRRGKPTVEDLMAGLLSGAITQPDAAKRTGQSVRNIRRKVAAARAAQVGGERAGAGS